MDLHVPAPSSSSDGLYDLVEPAPPIVPPLAPSQPDPSPTPPTPAASDSSSSSPPPAPPEGAKPRKGLLGGLFGRKVKGAEPEEAEAAAPTEGEAKAAKVKKKKRKRRRYDAPSWGVSLIVHVLVLGVLGAATFSTEAKKIVANINSALVSGKGSEEEALHVLATPGERSETSVGSEGAPEAGGSEGGGGGFSGIGTGPPSATPKVQGVGKGVGEGNSLPGVKVVAQVSGLNLLPSAAKLGVDLGGGGMIAGDVTFEAKDVGESLDQIAREILRHLAQHKLTVVWLFDESESMKDDQKAIKSKFDRVASELKVNIDNNKKQAAVLNHAIVGFGRDLHYELEKPTIDIDLIGKAIDRLKVDDSGTENTMEALQTVINHYSGLIKKDRRLLIVLVTDESGDDGSKVEETHQIATNLKVPIYVIGRQSLFGYDQAHLQYIDPVTKDVYWPAIRRGPETADVELVQWDGLHDRWDEQPSGFAPYELARIAKDTGGIYFLLPSEENMRVRQREKLYSIQTLKEYVPEYDNRLAYMERRNKSEFRRTLRTIIEETRSKSGEDPGFIFRRHFPVMPEELVPACEEAYQNAEQKLNALLAIQKQLESLKKLREREPLKRWQAHYDLMLAQIVTYQIKAYEYMACLKEMHDSPPRPKAMPSSELVVEWVIDHSGDRKAAKEKTEKKYVEAQALLKKVIELHPRTPWADLAQDELNRGLGCQRNEWHHNPKYYERLKFVPKY
ncbi:vWA domain-containing protein [Singulisphaera sp. PoT]|uniref:vWA domain-containing protein n=1 Tax=Singulisphaera sp. PoT TaxID=3411797 RepID=UPI003BF5B8BB